METFHTIAKALADPQRFEILELIIAGGEICCGEVAERCTVSQPTVSHHLKTLVDAGLISLRRDGQRNLYRAEPQVLDAYLRELKARTRLDVRAEA